MQESLLAAHIDLRPFPPTPQRLRELVRECAARGYGALYLSWGENFPWTLDRRFRAAAGYGEELVSGLYDEARRCGLELVLVFPATDELGFASRLPAYRHLFRPQSGRSALDLASAAGRSFFESLADDLVSLLPGSSPVLVSEPGPPAAGAELRFIAETFRRIGLRVQLRVRGDRTAADAREEAPFDARVAPVALVPREPATLPLRTLYWVRGDREDERLAAKELLDRVRPLAQTADAPPPLLLYSFQPEEPDGDRTILRSMIEIALRDLPSFAEKAERECAAPAAPAAGGSEDDGAHFLDELEAELSEGWRCARRLRELLLLGAPRDPAAATRARELLGRLEDHHDQAASLSDAFFDRFARRVDRASLDRALRSVVFPLYEEIQALLPRIRLREEEIDRRPGGEPA